MSCISAIKCGNLSTLICIVINRKCILWPFSNIIQIYTIPSLLMFSQIHPNIFLVFLSQLNEVVDSAQISLPPLPTFAYFSSHIQLEQWFLPIKIAVVLFAHEVYPPKTVPVLPHPILQWITTFPPCWISFSIESWICIIVETGTPSNSSQGYTSCLMRSQGLLDRSGFDI